MIKIQPKISFVITIFVCCVLLMILIVPLFTPYLTGTADGFAHKYRLVNFNQSLLEGNVHPRWVGNAVLGYGAPLFLFNYSVPYYIVDSIYRLGFSIQTSSQMYAALTVIVSFLCMYILANFLWGKWAGMIAGFAYIFAPYHLLTIYSYEGWGEMLAFVYPPLLLYLLLYALRQNKFLAIKGRFVFGVTIVVWVLFILTHNISSFITSPILVTLALIASRKNNTNRVYIGTILLLVGMISAFFVIPAITLTHTIKIPALLEKEMALRNQYMYPLAQQIRTSWSVLWTNRITYREFTIGIPLIIASSMGIISLVYQWLIRKRHMHPLFPALIVVVFVSLLLVDPISSLFYEFRPLQYVLYPYRFLFVATFAGSLASGYLLKKYFLVRILFIFVVVISGYPFIHPNIDIFPFPQSLFSKPQMLGFAVPTLKTMGIAEFLPAGADMSFLVREEQEFLNNGMLPEKFIVPSGSGSIRKSSIKQESLGATIVANYPLILTVNTLYYPNWTASIDGKHIPVSSDAFGRITLNVPTGTHEILLRFGYSPMEKLGWSISAFGMVLFILFLTYPRIIHKAIPKRIRTI